MMTRKTMPFLLLHLLLYLHPIHWNSATQVPFEAGNAEMGIEVPQDLRLAELQALHQSNHQLREMELADEVIHSIPFDEKHFNFDSADWVVYDLPNSTNEKMIVSAPNADPTKKLMISTMIKAPSNLIIRYQIHLTDDIPTKPSFVVFLISNDTKNALKEEYPKELWSNSTIQIKTDEECQLIFVGVLKDRGNRMAIRNFTVEDLSVSAPKRYGDTSSPGLASEHLLMGSGKQEEASVSTSESSSRVESNFSETKTGSEVNHSPRRSQVRIDPPTDQDNENLDNDTPLLNFSDDMTFSNDNFGVRGINPHYENVFTNEDGMQDDSVDSVEPLTGSQEEDLDTNNSLPSATPSSEEEYNWSTSSTDAPLEEAKSSSAAKDVFIFFVVLLVVVVSIASFVWWCRRRRRAEDEMPVFSRASSSEHGNPTFVNDQTNFEIGMNSEKPTNYKSFD